jgi:Mrp family chromosome partitioning ATPase
MVIIDTPPMMTMADARVIARHGDGVVLVVRANKTSRDSLRDACRRFSEDGTRVLGAILNDWNPKKSGRYGYYRYYSKYKHYYRPATEGDEKSDAG